MPRSQPSLTLPLDGATSASSLTTRPSATSSFLSARRAFASAYLSARCPELTRTTTLSYGLYLISSFIHFEPWHIFTCMVQYLMMLPSFINILLFYAFCNLHDVSW